MKSKKKGFKTPKAERKLIRSAFDIVEKKKNQQTYGAALPPDELLRSAL